MSDASLAYDAQTVEVPPVDIKLKPFDLAQTSAQLGVSGLGGASPAQASRRTEGFSDVFNHALHSVSEAQNTATRLQREVSLDNPTVSLEETMISMQRSNIGFQMALQVRNRVVQAYSEVMSMQV